MYSSLSTQRMGVSELSIRVFECSRLEVSLKSCRYMKELSFCLYYFVASIEARVFSYACQQTKIDNSTSCWFSTKQSKEQILQIILRR